jgi:hypothetical protein
MDDVEWLRGTARGAFPGGPVEAGLLHAADRIAELQTFVTDVTRTSPASVEQVYEAFYRMRRRAEELTEGR